MKKTLFVSLLMISACYCVTPWDCLPSSSINLTCTCTNISIVCSGDQDGSFDAVSVIEEILSTYYTSGIADYIVIDIKDLSFGANRTLHNITSKNLKLGSGLRSLPDNVFFGINKSLHQLNLGENFFPNVPSNALQILSKLEYLDLSHNGIISLTQNDFRGLDELKILNLQHNSITLLLHEPFLFLKNLENLQLSFNNIQNLDHTVFNYLNKLDTLDLSSNLLQVLPEDLFSGMSSLQKLVLDGNNFASIENLNFISSVSVLSAINCSIQGNLEQKSLSNLQNLTFLDLSHNAFQDIQSHALSSLRNLEVLNVSNNRIETLRKNAFSSLINLQTLILEDNEVIMMATDVFYNLTRLKHLNMNNNKLSGFICEYTSDLISLEVIELEDNQLKVVRSGTFKYSPKLRVLKLRGNTLECTCLASYFADYLLNSTLLNSSSVDEILCDTPVEHRGKRLVDIDYSSMKCIISLPCSSSFLSEDDYDYEESTTFLGESTTEILTTFASTPMYPASTRDLLGHNSSISYTEMTTESYISTYTSTETSIVTSTALSTPVTAIIKPISEIEVRIGNHTLNGTELCVDWMITTYVHDPISCSVSDRAKKITKKLLCPKLLGEFEKYCEADVADNSKVCIKVHLTASNKLVGKSCFDVNEVLHSKSTKIYETSTEVLQKFSSPKSVPMKSFNFTYFNIVSLNSSASHIQWKVSKQEPIRLCHLNLSITSDPGKHQSMLYPCKDDSVIYSFHLGVTYDVCLVATHLKGGVIHYCHEVSYFHQKASATHSGHSSESTFPIAVLIGLLIIALCIIVLLVARTILRKQIASDRYNVYEQEQKVQRRESRQQSGRQSARYSYTMTESTVS